MSDRSRDDLELVRAEKRGDLIALVGTSTRVLDDCRLQNGALIEAPVHLPSFPRAALPEPRCFPGTDLALALLAMDALGRDLRPALLPWLLARIEERHGALLAKSYTPGGEPTGDSDLAGTILTMLAIGRNPHSEPARSCQTLLAPVLETAFRSGENLPDITDAWATLASTWPGSVSSAPQLSRYLAECDNVGHPTGPETARLFEREFARILPSALKPRSPTSASTGFVWKTFASVLKSAVSGDMSIARVTFYAALDIADVNGHFPAWTPADAQESPPSPYLLSHLTFLLAAQLTGELAMIPNRGYSGRRR